jgi:RNA polymerase sigma-70 factor (ECF subfamily)
MRAEPGAVAIDPGPTHARVWGRAGVLERDTDFSGFFRDEFSPVVRTVHVIVRDRGRAEEIAQDAFVELFARWRKISTYQRPDAWVRRVAIRMAVRSARRERAREVLERQAATPSDPAPRDADVLSAVRGLPAAQRAAVALFYLEDRPVAEVADLLGCSPSTAKVHLHRARRRLAELLGAEASDVL